MLTQRKSTSMNDTQESEDIPTSKRKRSLEKSEERVASVGSQESRTIKNVKGVIVTYTSPEGTQYNVGDSVYIDSQRPDLPYFIGTIQEFKVTKRENVIMTAKWYYRLVEVPETVYQLLVQDRHSENNSGSDLIITNPVVKNRELFISDTPETYTVCLLRGKCSVTHYNDIHSAKDFEADLNCFFYILGYNPETRRLASTQGEIKIGSGHQAVLPQLRPKPKPNGQTLTDKEELTWKTRIEDVNLLMYLRAARSMAAFVGMCDGGSPEDGCDAASKDVTTINALKILHHYDYQTSKALQALIKDPVQKSVDKKWNEEDTKLFVKGLRQFGKNFFRIRKELIPSKQTSELVEFYYYWKKTPEAANQRIYRRGRRQSVLRRMKVMTRTIRQPSSEYIDLSSASEDELDSDDGEFYGYACRHCFATSSKDWHHGGRDKLLLCYDCRLYFRKYDQLPTIKTPREAPPFMFKPVKDDEATESRIKLRSRRHGELKGSTLRSGRNKHSDNSSPVAGISRKKTYNRNSPSTLSTSSESSTKSTNKKRKVEDDGYESPLVVKLEPEDESVNSTSTSVGHNDRENEEETPMEVQDVEPATEQASDVGAVEVSEESTPQDGNSEGSTSASRSSSPGDIDNDTENGETENENVENDENIESVENVESVEKIDNVEKIENVKDTETAENIENLETVENVESIEKVKNVENMEKEIDNGSKTKETVDESKTTEISIVKKEDHVGVDMNRELNDEKLDNTLEEQLTSKRTEQRTEVDNIKEIEMVEPSAIKHRMPSIQNCPQPSSVIVKQEPRDNYEVPSASYSYANTPMHINSSVIKTEERFFGEVTQLRESFVHSVKTEGTIIPPVEIPHTVIQESKSNSADVQRENSDTPAHSKEDIKKEIIEDLCKDDEEEDDDIKEESDGPRCPSPSPVIGDKIVITSRNAGFIRHWIRGRTTCSRTDLVFSPPPEMLRKRKEAALKRKAESEQKENEDQKKEKDKEKEKEKEKQAKRPSTPPANVTADAQITSSYGLQRAPPPPPAHGYVSQHCPPHLQYQPHDMPALHTLREYARPHVGLPPGHPLLRDFRNLVGPDPIMRMQMQSMYLGANREAQIDLVERELRERDMRERDFREREIRELQEREIRRHELELRERREREFREMKPGFEGFYGNAAPILAYAASRPGEPVVPAHHIPGVPPYLHMAHPHEGHPPGRPGMPPGEIVYPGQMERLTAERLHGEQLAVIGDQLIAVSRPGSAPHHHNHSHSHTHLHLHPGEHMLLHGNEPPGIPPGPLSYNPLPPPPAAASHPPPHLITTGHRIAAHPHARGEMLALHEEHQRQMLERHRFPRH
ncbi:arginine-glutamic acid dipeptide repeats protein-like [Anneissia japonica]|uniref:arginine-glutamic acid dipeptide repeats protein-like n=1 Tax=Anneissia japonica TaxID=1529436 RepID=UPI001425507F|nr:arginine-glutamic acid dipeptide repeats protein-like [Anneissia japonica]XP_033104594.1 arginine-glutamic acid dipeptide repeats protein-like [Anneissia japonica]